MMITEYGADAYDNTNQREWQNDEQNLGLQAGHWLLKFWPFFVSTTNPWTAGQAKIYTGKKSLGIQTHPERVLGPPKHA